MVYWAYENNIDSPNIAELHSTTDLDLRILQGMLDALRSRLRLLLQHHRLLCRREENTEAGEDMKNKLEIN